MATTLQYVGSAVAQPPSAVEPAGGTMIGQVLGERYLVEALLGEGGMAQVFRVRHLIIDKVFAAKVLHAEFRSHERMAARFLREARLVSRVEHANVINIVDFGKSRSGDAFYIMDFLEGTTLGERIDRGGPMAPGEALCVAELVCQALVPVHAAGAVHRDLNPQNIFLLDRPERLKLIDFGVARVGERLTAVGTTLGTPDYMAPEQVRGGETDGRTDLYALGITLFEMLTTRLPLSGTTGAQTLQNQLEMPVPPLVEVAPALLGLGRTQALLNSLLCKDPKGRPSSAAEAAALLRTAMTHDLESPTTNPGLVRPRGLGRVLKVLGGACLGGGTLGLVVAGTVATVQPEARLLKPGLVAQGPRAWPEAGHTPASQPHESPATEPPPDMSRGAPPTKPLDETEAAPAPVPSQRAEPRKASRPTNPKRVSPSPGRRRRKPESSTRRSSTEAWDLRDPF